MAGEVYTPIADAEVNPEAAGTSPLFYKLRDNVIAAFAGAAGAPKVARAALAAGFRPSYLGTGSDGAGPATTTSLDSGEYHYTSWTVNTGQVINTNAANGFLIFRVQGTVTLSGTAQINLNELGGAGAVASFETDGTNGALGYGGGSGGGGGNSLSNDGGDGGNSEAKGQLLLGGIGGVYSGGSGVNGGNGVAITDRLKRAIESGFEYDLFRPYGGGGGAGGTEGGAGTGKAGKNGGGGVIIIANEIVIAAGASILCKGGDADDSNVAGGNYGGGGGGGGGVVVLAASIITNDGTVDVAGGAVGVNETGADSGGGSGGTGYTFETLLG